MIRFVQSIDGAARRSHLILEYLDVAILSRVSRARPRPSDHRQANMNSSPPRSRWVAWRIWPGAPRVRWWSACLECGTRTLQIRRGVRNSRWHRFVEHPVTDVIDHEKDRTPRVAVSAQVVDHRLHGAAERLGRFSGGLPSRRTGARAAARATHCILRTMRSRGSSRGDCTRRPRQEWLPRGLRQAAAASACDAHRTARPGSMKSARPPRRPTSGDLRGLEFPAIGEPLWQQRHATDTRRRPDQQCKPKLLIAESQPTVQPERGLERRNDRVDVVDSAARVTERCRQTTRHQQFKFALQRIREAHQARSAARRRPSKTRQLAQLL